MGTAPRTSLPGGPYGGPAIGFSPAATAVGGRPDELRLELDIYHRSGFSRAAWASSGQTVRWRRDRILVDLNRPIASGSFVELAVRWSPGVQLVVYGRVLGHEALGTLVKIEKRRLRGKREGFKAAFVSSKPAAVIPELGLAERVLTARSGGEKGID